MNPEGADIVEYFYNVNPQLEITISTNGAARNKDFWIALGQTKAKVSFCLDGLMDTHHLYRQNTVWKTVINNAKSFIESGGHAVWKMIKFKHNVHQIEECKNLSIDFGFKEFQLVESTRVDAPVFDSKGNLLHLLGDYNGETSFPLLFHKKQTDLILLEDITVERKEKKTVRCEAKKNKEIYITSKGEVYPCCYTGFYPKTYGHGQYHQAANAQLVPHINKNNALEYALSECIEWFNEIELAWDKKTYNNGRLVICDDNCGN
jgi:sulfatase maturation enzyme AslB (radical SAM superfamily)